MRLESTTTSTAPALGQLCRLWSAALGVPTLAPDQHFFLAGGDSLQLAQLLLQVRRHFGVELPLGELADYSTPRKMLQRLTQSQATALRQEPLPGYAVTMFPAAGSQQGFWFGELQAGACGLYNGGLLLHLHGELSLPALAAAVNAVCRQFPLLRASLRWDLPTRHLQVHVTAPSAVALPLLTLEAQHLRAHALAVVAQPFDTATSLWRFQLYRLDAHHHALLLVCHHAASDGWSGGVLLSALAQAYGACLAEPDWQGGIVDNAYAVFCQRQWTALAGSAYRHKLAWWRQYLAQAAPLRLPAAHWPHRLARRQLALPVNQWHRLRQRCAGWQATPFAVFTAALVQALAQLCGQRDIVLAFPVANRSTAEEQDSIGCYMNLLPLRVRCELQQSPVALVALVQAQLWQVQSQALPFQSLVQALRPPLASDGNPLTTVVIGWQQFPAPAADFAALQCRYETLGSQWGQHLLKLDCLPAADGCNVVIEHAAGVLQVTWIEQLEQTWLQFCSQLTS